VEQAGGSRPQDGVDLVWARPERPPRGRARGLSRQQIVRAAIGIADREGLDALTMRRVAQRLGAGTMSLYWYVRSKDELIELMRDEVAGEQTLRQASGDWRSDLATFARDTRASYLRHPWLASVLVGLPPIGPNSLRQDELALEIVAGLGLDLPTQMAIPAAVHCFVIGYVLRELDEQEVLRRTGASEQEWRASVAPYLEQVLASGRYPNLQRVIASGEQGEQGGDEAFERTLEIVLDGIAARLPERRRRPAAGVRASRGP
jgi:AcrR family transcriptional regulator